MIYTLNIYHYYLDFTVKITKWLITSRWRGGNTVFPVIRVKNGFINSCRVPAALSWLGYCCSYRLESMNSVYVSKWQLVTLLEEEHVCSFLFWDMGYSRWNTCTPVDTQHEHNHPQQEGEFQTSFLKIPSVRLHAIFIFHKDNFILKQSPFVNTKLTFL